MSFVLLLGGLYLASFVGLMLWEVVNDLKGQVEVYRLLYDENRARRWGLHTAIIEALQAAETDWPNAIEILQEAIR